ncbi:MAG: ribonuclease III [Lachnospiraceae bacterium]|nr:ribonuclease III [Lachnospiraceae bacterium]
MTDFSQYGALALAYIGDTVYELYNREKAVRKADRNVHRLHEECAHRANAAAQARIAEYLEPLLTEEESSIYHRGRNAEVNTKPKNMSVQDYHKATGLEAVIGWLYLEGRHERIAELIGKGWAFYE